MCYWRRWSFPGPARPTIMHLSSEDCKIHKALLSHQIRSYLPIIQPCSSLGNFEVGGDRGDKSCRTVKASQRRIPTAPVQLRVQFSLSAGRRKVTISGEPRRRGIHDERRTIEQRPWRAPITTKHHLHRRKSNIRQQNARSLQSEHKFFQMQKREPDTYYCRIQSMRLRLCLS